MSGWTGAIATWVHETPRGLPDPRILGAADARPRPADPSRGHGVFHSRPARGSPGRPSHKFRDVIVACGIGVVIGEQIKNGFKWLFGRPWPETWTHNNPSYIGNQDYVFHWFRGGGEFSSFPSPAIRQRRSPSYPCCGFATRAFGSLMRSSASPWWLGWSARTFISSATRIAGAFLGSTVGWMTVLLYDRAPAIPLIHAPALARSSRRVITSRRVRPEVAGPMTGSAKQSPLRYPSPACAGG